MKELEKDFREKHEENEELQKRKDKESGKIHRLKLENCWLKMIGKIKEEFSRRSARNSEITEIHHHIIL